jgi:hypothetical protein
MAEEQQGQPNGNFKAAYEKVCESYHAIDDFRLKLLGLLPLASGTGIFLLLQEKSKFDPKYLLYVGIFGFLVTLGLYIYELRGIQRCIRFSTIGKDLEHKMNVQGQFRRWPHSVGRFINEPIAAGVIYAVVLAGWAFVATAPVPVQPDAAANMLKLPIAVTIVVLTGILLTGFLSALLFYWNVREDWYAVLVWCESAKEDWAKKKKEEMSEKISNAGYDLSRDLPDLNTTYIGHNQAVTIGGRLSRPEAKALCQLISGIEGVKPFWLRDKGLKKVHFREKSECA